MDKAMRAKMSKEMSPEKMKAGRLKAMLMDKKARKESC
jgi:hypothetical protein